MKELPEKEVLAQLEEAYARATVALTRAQKLCIIMGPLDMRGLLGAATVIGCLDNTAAYHAIEDSKALHARRWQTKEGMYRIKRQALPDIRDAPLHDACFVVFCFLFAGVMEFLNPPRVLDLDDRQGLIASSAMQ